MNPIHEPQVLAALITAHMAAITTYASQALRGCFLLNVLGGIAAFTRPAMLPIPAALCAIGAVIALIACGFTWLSQRAYKQLDMRVFMRSLSGLPVVDRRFWCLDITALCSALLSLALFIVASFMAAYELI